MNKIYTDLGEAIGDVTDGSVIAIAGFLSAGCPRILLRALIEKDVRDLTMACGCGPLIGAKEELNDLLRNGQIKKVIDSYPLARSMSKGQNDLFEQKVRSGEIEVEIYPMGTLAEKFRAGGAGIAAFYVPTGIGTPVEKRLITNIRENGKKKETKLINGRNYILEYALKPDFAFIHAYKADREGNLLYRKTARNFSPVMATAAEITIAETETLVEPGEIDPDSTHTPGIYVNRVVKVPRIVHDIFI